MFATSRQVQFRNADEFEYHCLFLPAPVNQTGAIRSVKYFHGEKRSGNPLSHVSQTGYASPLMSFVFGTLGHFTALKVI